jgi:DNA-binding NarL/FixJ family response regulator
VTATSPPEGPAVGEALGPAAVPTGAIRVVIVDDHALFRRGLDRVLADEPDIEVVGEAGDGVEAVARVRELTPDVVIMDVRMPRATGIDAARTLRALVPETKVIMLTVSDLEEDLYEAVKAGVNGYLLKEVAIGEVADAVRAVAAGHSLVSPSMASKLFTEFNALAERAEDRQRALSPRLTERELEVLKLVAKGLSNREIGGELYIAENTVKNHVRNVLEKLQLHSRMEAVVYAMREKLLDVD